MELQTMQAEERAMRMIRAAQANQSELRSILRLEQIAIKGAYDPTLVTAAELKELCSLVLRHVTGEPSKPAGPRRSAGGRPPAPHVGSAT